MNERVEILKSYITEKVNEGFDSRDEIIELAVEYAFDDGPVPELRPLAERLTDAAILSCHEQQADWIGPTDCDKLDSAFALLESQGVVARQNFTCCNTCGFAEIGGEIRTPRCGRPPIGFAFYHSQDTDRARESGTIWVKFASGHPDHADEAIGDAVINALTKSGLNASWNGDSNTAVQIAGIVWRKRRTDFPPYVSG
jgi:hypothetical protein